MSAKKSQVTLVIPAYNEQKHLLKCLQSIARQTVPPAAVVVVDNNSTDQTSAIAAQFPFVQLLHESRQGVVYARNRGFNAVRKGVIGRIDADTVLPPDWVARVQRYFSVPAHQTQALTGSGYFYNIRLPHFFGHIESFFAYTINRLLLGHYITYGSNMALPVELWRIVRQSACQRSDIHEDLDLAIHLHHSGYRIDFQRSLMVGVKMRRVRSDRSDLLPNLMLWPQTLKVHGRKTWVFGWLGAILLYSAWPLAWILERIARAAGRQPLPE